MEVEDLVWTGDESRGRRTPGGRIRKANRIRGGRGRGAVYASEEEINCTTSANVVNRPEHHLQPVLLSRIVFTVYSFSYKSVPFRYSYTAQQYCAASSRRQLVQAGRPGRSRGCSAAMSTTNVSSRPSCKAQAILAEAVVQD